MMEWFNILRARLRAVFRRESVLRDIEEELRVHVEMETETNIERGMPPAEARAAALKSFGALGRNTELGYDIRGGGWLETLWQDFRYGVRMLMKNPSFTLVAVITLALGIGANTAIFSAVDAVLLKPLPFREPDRLMRIFDRTPKGDRNSVSAANFLDWRKENRVFEGLAASLGTSFNFSEGDRPEVYQGMRVSADYFNLLDVGTALGRTFVSEEEHPGKDRVVILSHRLWRERFGADPRMIGKTIKLNDEPYEVIGVLLAESNFDRSRARLWVPLAFNPEQVARDYHNLAVIGRLKEGVSLTQARAEMEGIAKGIEARFPKTNHGWGVTVEPMKDHVIGNAAKQMTLTLAIAVGFLLLIACANVANLTLTRAASRQKEITVRAALGASRFRLARQFLTESALLSLCGGAVGVLIGRWSIDALNSFRDQFGLPSVNQISLDHRALLFTLGASLLTGMLFGAVPAWRASRPDLNDTLKEGGRGATLGPGGRRLQGALVIAEVALASMLLIGAGLLLRSFWGLLQIDPGFQPDHLLTMHIELPIKKYQDPAQIKAFYQQAIERVQSLPGVQETGLAQSLPLLGWNFGMRFAVEGQTLSPVSDSPSAHFQMVSPGYFSVMKIPLLKGRGFTDQDRSGAPPVVVINQALARRFFPDQDPIGKKLLIETLTPGRAELGPAIPWDIVGVIGDVKVWGLDANPSMEIYAPFSQSPQPGSYLVARTTADPTRLAKAIQQEIAALDKDQPVTDLKSMEEVVAASAVGRRFNAGLIGFFAAVALALASLGIYGVISHSVSQRTHEIGVRMALGAQIRDVLKLIVSQGMKLALIGVVIGMAGAFAVTRLVSSLLFGVAATDPVTFAGAAILLVAVALLACWIPARRATKIDPLTALRQE